MRVALPRSCECTSTDTPLPRGYEEEEEEEVEWGQCKGNVGLDSDKQCTLAQGSCLHPPLDK